MAQKIIMKRDMRNTFIDLYSGCGGFSLGMIQAGMKCLAAVEYAPDAAFTYWRNLCLLGWSSLVVDPERQDSPYLKVLERLKKEPETDNTLFEIPDDYWTSSDSSHPALSLWLWDILKLTPEMIMERYDFKPGELGVVVGGPPCQGFSTSNPGRHMEDARNEHPFRFLHYVEVIQPRYFIIENVPGILNMGKKKGEKEGPFPKWIREAGEKAGYVVKYDIHNACDYGVPQSRRRVLFVGTRKDLYEQGKQFTFPPPTHTYNYFDYYGEKANKVVSSGQMSMFEVQKKTPPPGEPYVDVYEAIGDLNAIRLSSSRSSDLIANKVPFGDMERIGSGNNNNGKVGRLEDDDNADSVLWNSHYYYKDRFNGIFFARNHVNYHPGLSDDRAKHYHRCPSCNKFNKIIRPKCWSCKHPLEVKNPLEI